MKQRELRGNGSFYTCLDAAARHLDPVKELARRDCRRNLVGAWHAMPGIRTWRRLAICLVFMFGGFDFRYCAAFRRAIEANGRRIAKNLRRACLPDRRAWHAMPLRRKT